MKTVNSPFLFCRAFTRSAGGNSYKPLEVRFWRKNALVAIYLIRPADSQSGTVSSVQLQWELMSKSYKGCTCQKIKQKKHDSSPAMKWCILTELPLLPQTPWHQIKIGSLAQCSLSMLIGHLSPGSYGKGSQCFDFYFSDFSDFSAACPCFYFTVGAMWMMCLLCLSACLLWSRLLWSRLLWSRLL